MIATILSPRIPDSYSRQLDMQVQASELPYGYDHDGPPADTGDYKMVEKEERRR